MEQKTLDETSIWEIISGGCVTMQDFHRKHFQRNYSGVIVILAEVLIKKYESGNLNIPIRVIITLKEIYGCTYDDFFKDLIK